MDIAICSYVNRIMDLTIQNYVCKYYYCLLISNLGGYFCAGNSTSNQFVVPFIPDGLR